MREVRPWIAQLLSTDLLDPQARAELTWTALAVALEVGDDQAALTAGRRLERLVPGIGSPALRAVSQLAIAWFSPISGDFDGALQTATESLEQLRRLDEPFWTALAAGSVGAVEKILGRYDDAMRHMREARDLGDRFGSTWLAAWSRVQLGALSILRGDLHQARPGLTQRDAVAIVQDQRNTGTQTS